jgi:hypothetical protein
VEYGGLFGWLVNAGYNPGTIDMALASGDDLRDLRAILFLNPGYVSEETADKLVAFVQEGGVLLNFLWPGRFGEDFRANGGGTRFHEVLFPAREAKCRRWLWGSGPVFFRVGRQHGVVRARRYRTIWYLPEDATPFLWDGARPAGDRPVGERTDRKNRRGEGSGGERARGARPGKVIGYYRAVGRGRAYFIGTHLGSDFNLPSYYRIPAAELGRRCLLLRSILAEAGERPALRASIREEVWARRLPDGDILLFLVSDHGSGRVKIRFRDLRALGLRMDARYEIREILSQREFGVMSGGKLLNRGLEIRLPRLGTAVFLLRRTDGIHGGL